VHVWRSNVREGDESLKSVTEAADEVGISARMIRHYTKIGVLHAERRSGNRYFNATAISELKLVCDLRDLGFSLEEIGNVLGHELRSEVDFKPKGTNLDLSGAIQRLRTMRETIVRVISVLEHRMVDR
jgi:DNA-binding transcriptional MerR regulator